VALLMAKQPLAPAHYVAAVAALGVVVAAVLAARESRAPVAIQAH